MIWVSIRRRRSSTSFNLSFAVLATLFGLFWLVWLLWTLLQQRSAMARSGRVYSGDPAAGQDGGLANAIVGSLLMTVSAC